MSGFLLFNRQWVRAWDGQLVEEHQELAEGLEEGPAGEQADAFIGVYRPVGDHLLLHRAEYAQLDLLLLAQLIHWIWLVELDGWSVHLQTDIRHAIITSLCNVLASQAQLMETVYTRSSFQRTNLMPTFVLIFTSAWCCCLSPFHQKRWLRQTWRRRAEDHVCLVPNTRSWHPWANKTEGLILTEGKTHNPPVGNGRWGLENGEKRHSYIHKCCYGLVMKLCHKSVHPRATLDPKVAQTSREASHLVSFLGKD